MTESVVFRDLALVLGAAVVGGGLAHLTRQPLILGYVLAGILVSPLTPGLAVTGLETFHPLADIGVVLLMFSIGIEFSVRDLLRVRWVALLGAPAGMALSIMLGWGAGLLLGWPPLQGIVVGMIISVGSTMVVARILLDRGELRSHYGRIAMGTLLVEDLAVVVLIVLIPALGAVGVDGGWSIAVALGRAAIVLVPFAILIAKIAPAVMTYVARMRNQELFLLFALAAGLSTAALTEAVGLSLALGAFLAGLIISESDYAHELLARLLPLREAFGALFFVAVGALIDPHGIAQHASLLGILVGLVVVGKFLIRTVIVRLFGEPLPIAARVGASLAQIGEFSFVMAQAARSAGHIDSDVYNATLAASLVTILVNAVFVRAIPAGVARASLTGVPVPPPDEDERPAPHVVLCGFGRVGSQIGEALETFEIPYTVLEVDPDIVKGLRQRGVRSLYGDGTHRHVLERAGVGHAGLVVVAIPDVERTDLVVRHARALNAQVPILARAHHGQNRERLVRAGATEVIVPELEAAATLIRHALKGFAFPRERVLAYLERFRAAMESGAGEVLTVASGLPQIADVVIGRGALAGQSLREARILERLGVTVIAVDHAGGPVTMASAETILQAGDRVRVFGLPGQIDAFRAEAERPD